MGRICTNYRRPEYVLPEYVLRRSWSTYSGAEKGFGSTMMLSINATQSKLLCVLLALPYRIPCGALQNTMRPPTEYHVQRPNPFFSRFFHVFKNGKCFSVVLPPNTFVLLTPHESKVVASREPILCPPPKFCAWLYRILYHPRQFSHLMRRSMHVGA
jgi:hypothetical protein